MPIWLGKFTIHSINEFFSKQEKEANKPSKNKGKEFPKGPAVKRPTYSTKARK